MKITVFTPTYNRRVLIEVLFDSLMSQSSYDFEWLVVDDGSSDETDYFFDVLSNRDLPFPVKYIKNSHGGKHRAVNTGLLNAKGELFFIVDSDDYIKNNAIEKIIECYDNYDDKSQICGIRGLIETSDGKILGEKFPSDRKNMNLVEMIRTKFNKDHLEVFVTSIFKKFPYPEIENEWHIAPSITFLRMANAGYNMILLNEAYYVRDYLPHGLTNIGDKKSTENYIGYTIRSKEIVKTKGIGCQKKYKTIFKYIYISKINNISMRKISENLQISLFSSYLCSFIMKLIPKKVIGS